MTTSENSPNNSLERMEVEEIEYDDDSKISPDESLKNITAIKNDKKEDQSLPVDRENLQKRKDNSQEQVEYADMKKSIRSLLPKSTRNEQEAHQSKLVANSFPFCKALFFTLLPIAFLLIALLLMTNEFAKENHCKYSHFANATEELKRLIYGQEEAISNLINYLERDTSCIRVIALVGGTGVGKSHTVNIFRKNIPPEVRVSQFMFPPYNNLDSHVLPTSSSCNLVILENLKERNIEDVVHLVQSMKHVEENTCITFLTVFNLFEVDENLMRVTHLTQDLDKIQTIFDNANLNSIVIGYETLNEETLSKCIAEAVRENRVTLTQSQTDLIKQYLSVNNSGCKGVDAQVRLLAQN